MNGRVGRRRDGLGKFPGSLYQARPPSKLIATISREDGRRSSQMCSTSEVVRSITPRECGGVFSEETTSFKKERWKGGRKQESLIGHKHSKTNITPTKVPSSGQGRAGVTQANLTRGNVRDRTCDDCPIFLHRILKEGKKKQ